MPCYTGTGTLFFQPRHGFFNLSLCLDVSFWKTSWLIFFSPSRNKGPMKELPKQLCNYASMCCGPKHISKDRFIWGNASFLLENVSLLKKKKKNQHCVYSTLSLKFILCSWEMCVFIQSVIPQEPGRSGCLAGSCVSKPSLPS